MSIISDRIFDALETMYWRVESCNTADSGPNTHYIRGPICATEEDARRAAKRLVGTCRNIFIVDTDGRRTHYMPD